MPSPDLPQPIYPNSPANPQPVQDGFPGQPMGHGFPPPQNQPHGQHPQYQQYQPVYVPGPAGRGPNKNTKVIIAAAAVVAVVAAVVTVVLLTRGSGGGSAGGTTSSQVVSGGQHNGPSSQAGNSGGNNPPGNADMVKLVAANWPSFSGNTQGCIASAVSANSGLAGKFTSGSGITKADAQALGGILAQCASTTELTNHYSQVISSSRLFTQDQMQCVIAQMPSWNRDQWELFVSIAVLSNVDQSAANEFITAVQSC